jgi:hypothetical protein
MEPLCALQDVQMTATNSCKCLSLQRFAFNVHQIFNQDFRGAESTKQANAEVLFPPDTYW